VVNPALRARSRALNMRVYGDRHREDPDSFKWNKQPGVIWHTLYPAERLRSAIRERNPKDYRDIIMGFRVAKTLP
jgi:formylglycine-generating enzyme required for sulfatase activity